MKFFFSSFRAVNDIVQWREYMEGHAGVLRAFGITNLTSHKEDWIENPNVFVIVARNANNEMVGGIKLHSFHENFQLPVEFAIGDLDIGIHQMVKQSAENGGVGEICGLWIIRESGRLGLAYFLSRAAISICPSVSALDIYGISSPFTLNMFLQLGYHVINSLGEGGNYSYPTPDFISTAVMISNTVAVEKASELHRSRIFDLRLNPIQSAIEEHGELRIEIDYNLLMC